MSRKKVTLKDINSSLEEVDTEYREALADAMLEFKYISDTPLRLSLGNDKQRNELEKAENKPLKKDEIIKVINYIKDKMKGDFQFGEFKEIANHYISVANNMDKMKNIER